MKKIIILSLCVVTVVVISIVATGIATGSSSGSKTGRYATGCTPCHGSKQGTLGTIVIDGPTTMKPGEKATFYVVTAAMPLGPVGGIDAAVVDSSGLKAGSMAAGLHTQVKDGDEITHSVTLAGKPVNGRVWSFDWTAPSGSGSYTLKVASNAVNGDGAPNYDTLPSGVGDTWYLGQQGITVSP